MVGLVTGAVFLELGRDAGFLVRVFGLFGGVSVKMVGCW